MNVSSWRGACAEIYGREVEVKIYGRFHKWNKWVYDATATDISSSISITHKHKKSTNGVRKHAIQDLKVKIDAMLQQQRIAKEREEELKRLKEQQREQQRRHLINTRDLLNAQVAEKLKLYQHKQSQLFALATEIAAEEKEIDKFKIERENEGNQLVITLGATGGGKSTFCNRMAKDKSLFGDKGPFQTSGDSASCTQEFTKLCIQVGNHKITIVDTPGFGDSFGRDRYLIYYVYLGYIS